MSENKGKFNGWYVVAMLAVISAAVCLSGRGGNDKKSKQETPSTVTPTAVDPAKTTPTNAQAPVVAAPTPTAAEKPAATNAPSTATATAVPGVAAQPASKTAVEVRPQDSTPAQQDAFVRRRRVEPEATKRLNEGAQVIKVALTTTGRGENADWGVKGICSFVLTCSVVCDAEVISKSETPLGEIKVVEKRTYTQARQDLQLSDIDVALAINETFPMRTVTTVVNTIGGILAGCGAVGTGTAISMASERINQMVEVCDGKSVRGVLAMVGVDVPKKLEAQINSFVNNKVKDIFKTNIVEGKSYLITYYQDKNTDMPLRVDFTYADGSKVKTEEEWLILRRANVFIDSKIAPDRSCSLGDTWPVDASDFECLMDPYVNGTYSGSLAIERVEDDAQGNWQLKVRPGTISILTDQGRGAGEIRFSRGDGIVDAHNAYIKGLMVTGSGMMKNLTRHHLLFNSKFVGECSFRAAMTTESKKK